jgi:hypothetical protein
VLEWVKVSAVVAMPNPSPRQTPEFLEKQFKPKGAESLGKVIGVRFPLAIDALLQTLPDKTDFIRQAVIEKLQREKLVPDEVKPADIRRRRREH